MSVTVKVRNKDKLARKLKQLAPAVQQAITDANGVTAHEMAATARGLVPVRTGTLRNSIVRGAGRNRDGGLADVSGRAVDHQGGTWRPGFL